MRFLRSAGGQSLLYVLVLGALLGLPGIAVYEIGGRDSFLDEYPGLGGLVRFFFVTIALIIAIPAMTAAAVVWLFFLRRHNGSPPADITPYCWILTLAGTYLLTPFWILILAATTKGIPAKTDLLGFGFLAMAMGFMATIPYVAPVTFLGSWLWVRRIRPGVMTFRT